MKRYIKIDASIETKIEYLHFYTVPTKDLFTKKIKLYVNQPRILHHPLRDLSKIIGNISYKIRQEVTYETPRSYILFHNNLDMPAVIY